MYVKCSSVVDNNNRINTITICDYDYATHSHTQVIEREFQEKIYQLMNMDVIKLFAKKVKEFKTLIQTMRIYNLDIGVEFSIVK